MAKAPPKKEEKKPEAAAEGEEQPPKKKGKLPLILGLVVLLAAAGGGGAWFFMSKDKGADAPAQQAKPKPPVFVPLDTFTVKLAADQNDQYLQVAATLKVLDQPSGDAVKLYMPEIRHRTLILLSSKTVSAISSGEGQERLAEEIRQTANNILLAAAGRPVKPVSLEVAKPAGEAAPAEETKPDAAAEAPKPAEGDKPQEGDAPVEAPVAAAAPAAAKPSTPATVLPRAAADDPVQSVFFTSFIIQ